MRESKQLLIGVSFTGCLFTIRRPVEKGEREVLLIGSQVPGHCIAKANEMFP